MNGINLWGDQNALLADETWLSDEARILLVELVSEYRSDLPADEWVDRLDVVVMYAEQNSRDRGEGAIDRMAIASAWAWCCRYFGWPFCATFDLEETL